jgi:hypothetical protein
MSSSGIILELTIMELAILGLTILEWAILELTIRATFKHCPSCEETFFKCDHCDQVFSHTGSVACHVKRIHKNLNCFAFNFLTLAGSNCPFCVLFYSIPIWLWSKKGHKKGQFEPARVRKLNEKHFSSCTRNATTGLSRLRDSHM